MEGERLEKRERGLGGRGAQGDKTMGGGGGGGGREGCKGRVGCRRREHYTSVVRNTCNQMFYELSTADSCY